MAALITVIVIGVFAILVSLVVSGFSLWLSFTLYRRASEIHTSILSRISTIKMHQEATSSEQFDLVKQLALKEKQLTEEQTKKIIERLKEEGINSKRIRKLEADVRNITASTFEKERETQKQWAEVYDNYYKSLFRAWRSARSEPLTRTRKGH